MLSNYSFSVSKVVCIDLLNSSWEDIQNYFIFLGVYDGLEMYLKHLYTSLHNDLSNLNHPHLVYIEGSYIIGTNRYDKLFSDAQLGGLEILPEIPFNRTDKSVFNLLEEVVSKNKDLTLNHLLLSQFNEAYNEFITNKRYDTTFIHAHIEVANCLAINIRKLTYEYKITIHFLDCKIEPNRKCLTLNSIYYKSMLPIIFVFKDDKNQNYIGWNKEYLVALKNITPLNLNSISKAETLNIILDKINMVGIANIEKQELEFLNKYSKL